MPSVFQNIDPPSPSPPGECVLPPTKAGGTHSPGGEGGGGSIFWKTQDIGLAYYSNNLSTRYSKQYRNSKIYISDKFSEMVYKGYLTYSNEE